MRLLISIYNYSKINKLILTAIVVSTLISCSPQVFVMQNGFKSFPSRKDADTVVIYKKLQDIPINSEQIGRLEAVCMSRMKDCDSTSVFSSAETKIKKAGGNALLITDFQKPSFWNNSKLSLSGDVFLIHDFLSPPDTTLSFTHKHLYLGFGFGPETGISFLMPKFSYYNFQNRKYFETYYAIEASAWLVQGFWLSFNCLYGIKKDLFTFDTSLGAWWFPSSKLQNVQEENRSYFHTTINPKIGIKFWKLWVKAGPSIHLYRNYSSVLNPPGIVNIGKIGKMFYNFEILIKL